MHGLNLKLYFHKNGVDNYVFSIFWFHDQIVSVLSSWFMLLSVIKSYETSTSVPKFLEKRKKRFYILIC